MSTIPPFMPGLPGVTIFNDFSGLYRPTASNADLDRLYSTSVAIYAAANFWGETMSLVQWKVLDKDKQPVNPDLPEIQALRHNMPDILHRSMISEKFRGYNLLYKERNPLNNRVYRLRWMNFNMYELDEHFQSGLIGFRVFQGGTNYKPIYTNYIDRDDGVYWNLIDLQDDFDGVAAAEVAFMYAGVDVEAGTTMLSYFQNMAIPALFIQPHADGKFQPTEREAADLRTLFRKIVRGAMNFGRTIISPARWEIQQVQSKMEDLKMGELISTAREAVRIAMDVPKFVISSEGTSYAEAYEERRQWLHLSFMPRANKIASYLEDQLIRPVYPDYTIEPDFSKVPGMKEEAERLTTTITTQVNSIARDLYSAQEELGIEPDPAFKGIYVIQGVPVPKDKIPTFYATMQAQGGLSGALPTAPGFGGGAPATGVPTGDNSTGAPPAQPLGGASASKDVSTKSAAIMLDIGAVPDLIGLQNQCKQLCAGQTVEWNAPDSFHVTLITLPAVEDAQIALLRGYVASLQVEPMDLRIGSLGTFDNLGSYAIRFMLRSNAALTELQRACVEFCEQNGIPVSQHSLNYKPHVTMGYSNVNPGRLTYDTPLVITPRGIQLGVDDTIAYERPFNMPALKSAHAHEHTHEPEDELWLDDAEFKELKQWRILMARKGIDYAFAANVLPVESIAFGRDLLSQGYGVDAAADAMKAHIVSAKKKIDAGLLAKAWDESKHPRADNGQFGSGTGGGGVTKQPKEKKPKENKPDSPKPSWSNKHPDVAVDKNGNPEYIVQMTGWGPTKNPKYKGKPSGKKPPEDAPHWEEVLAEQQGNPLPDTSLTTVKPTTTKPTTTHQPKKPAPKPINSSPSWADQSRKPGVDSDGYMDYANVNDDAVRTKAENVSKAQTKSLSPEQRSSVTTYTGQDYEKINRGLRSGNPAPEYQNVTAHMDTAINQSELPENTILYRGVYVDDRVAANLKPGKTFSDKAYTSTTLSQPVANGFTDDTNGAIMRIKAPKGQKGLSVQSISEFPLEREILLPRNTKYKVTKVFRDPDTGKMYVDAEIVGS